MKVETGVVSQDGRNPYDHNAHFMISQAVPCTIPAYYQKELSKRQKQIDTWQHMVKDAGLTRDQRKEFQALVETRFHVSLVRFGQVGKSKPSPIPVLDSEGDLGNSSIARWRFVSCLSSSIEIRLFV